MVYTQVVYTPVIDTGSSSIYTPSDLLVVFTLVVKTGSSWPSEGHGIKGDQCQ